MYLPIKSFCLCCGRILHYGKLEVCQQCDVYTNKIMRRELRRVDNAVTRRPDIRKLYRLP